MEDFCTNCSDPDFFRAHQASGARFIRGYSSTNPMTTGVLRVCHTVRRSVILSFCRWTLRRGLDVVSFPSGRFAGASTAAQCVPIAYLLLLARTYIASFGTYYLLPTTRRVSLHYMASMIPVARVPLPTPSTWYLIHENRAFPRSVVVHLSDFRLQDRGEAPA